MSGEPNQAVLLRSRLASRGISVNPGSAYFHDHLFVPSARAGEALEVLTELARGDASLG